MACLTLATTLPIDSVATFGLQTFSLAYKMWDVFLFGVCFGLVTWLLLEPGPELLHGDCQLE